jgi:hypothetical protein
MVLNELYSDEDHQSIKDALDTFDSFVHKPRLFCAILILGKYKIKQTFPFPEYDTSEPPEIQENWKTWLDIAKEDYREVLGQFPMGFADRVKALKARYEDESAT